MRKLAFSPSITLVLCLLIGATAVHAQPVAEFTEELDFNRPEAWAMARAASLLVFSGTSAPMDRERGDIEFGLELIWNPDLSEDERQVGFNGLKVEEINRLPIIPRPRAAFGVGWRTTIEVSYLPPLEVDGIEANILALAAERPLTNAERFVLGLRVFGQAGKVEGDITCPEGTSDNPPGPNNPSGCENTSTDEITLNTYGIALAGGYRFGDGSAGAPAIHFGVNGTYMDLIFQVDALTFGFFDRTRMVADDWTYSVNAGFSWSVSPRFRLGFEAFYSPLDVIRQGSTEERTDELFNARTSVTFSF